MTLTLVVVGADREQLRRFEVKELPTKMVLIANERGTPLSTLANRELDICDTDVFGLVHADVGFGPGALAGFEKAAAVGAVCGLVGITKEWLVRWANSNPGPVLTLDGCSVFFRKDSGLRFDSSTFDGFHCHVEDLCMQAGAAGIPCLVPEGVVASHCGLSTNKPDWQAQYRVHRDRLGSKWPEVITT